MDTQAIPDLDKGQELYAARRYAEAEAFFREAAVHHPALSAAYRGLARSLAALTRFADAIEQYRKAGELLRSDAPERDAVLTEQRETLRNWGEALSDRGRLEEAAAKYEEALRIDPDDVDTYEGLDHVARVLAEKQRFNEADKLYQEANDFGREKNARNRRVILRLWGQALSQRDRFDEAAAKYQEALSIEPDDASTYEGLDDIARALAEKQRFDEADKLYQRAYDFGREKNAGNRRVILRRWGEALSQRDRFDEAAAKYQEALSIKPDDQETYGAYAGLARTLAQKQRFDEAEKLYKQINEFAQKNSPSSCTVILHSWGRALSDLGLFDEAAVKYQEALSIDPNDAGIYKTLDGLARALAEKRRFDEADELYRRANERLRERNVGNRRIILRLWGNALLLRDRFDEAVAKYDEALKIEPDDVRTYSGYVRLAYALAKKRFDEAEKVYQQINEFARKNSPSNCTVILRSWGATLSDRGLFDEAAAKYQEALSIEPDDASTYEGLDDVARALAEKQRFDEADKLYQRAYDFGREKNAGNRRVILRRWGEALSQRDRFDEAAAKYQEALSIEPDDQETCDAYADLAHTLAEKQRFDEVDKLYQQANELLREKNAGNRSAILRWWGEALSQRDLFDEAVAKYQEALSIEPDAEIHELLGGVLADTMRFDEAIEQYRAAAELRPKEPRILCSWGDVLKSKDLPEQAVAKYREALQIEDGDATAHYGLGLGLSELQDFDTAIAQFDRARKLWQKSQETGNESLALRQSAYALNQTERFEEAAQKCKSAVEIAPDEAWGYFDFANVLSDGGRYRDAIDQLGKAIKLDPDNPYLHHNKADFSFRLGRYEEGWREWDEAKRCYRQALRKGVIKSDHASQATYFGDVLREVYYDYRASEAHYRKALDKDKDNYLAWAGLAILYQQWSDSDEPSPEAQAKLSFTVARARELLERRTERGVPFATLLSLADLHIETHDWTEAENNLERAAKVCGKSRLRRGQVSGRLGLIRFRTQRYAEAIENFREALLARPDDMTLRTSLGRALLQSKQFDAAEVEFARVLKSARGNIDARLGLAQLCIDLADDGDPDRYVSAEEHLETALELGRNGEGGSVRLDGSELANVYYLRGYTRVKRYEKDTLLARLVAPLSSLNGALSDFEQCRAANPGHPKASAAIAKIKKQFQRQRGESLTDFIGPLVIVVAGFAVFVLAQLDFYFHDTRLGLPNKPAMQGVGYYIAATFGALMFMVAGLYLPKVLKLKVGAIELEKTSVEQVSAPSGLDIGRLSMS